MDTMSVVVWAGVILFAMIAFGLLVMILRWYKLCPSNRILVRWGLKSGSQSAQVFHGGGAWVIPIFQNYAYLSLEPMQIEVPLKGALSAENIRVNVPSVFTVAVGSESAVRQNSAIRLLGLSHNEIKDQASDIIFGQLRQVIASMKIEEINRDRDKFLSSVQESLEPELEKIGLVLLNVNITDITDDSGYIDAIGRKAASAAIQQAEIDVAEQQKSGSIGVARAKQEEAIQVANADKEKMIGTKNAERERSVRVADLEREQQVGVETARFEQEARIKEAERDMRIKLADADALAIGGENEAKASVAGSEATLAVKEAEAYQLGETRKREAEAAVREAQYAAETKAAKVQAEKIEAERRAELEAPARAQKAKIMVDAEAEAERNRLVAEGEAKAIFAKLEAEARGQYETLSKKAEGLGEIISACGGPQAAFQLLMLEHLDELSRTASEAISNIKFDKVIVWENGGQNGNGATAGFLQNMAKTLPPVLQIMEQIGGVKMPEYFGEMVEEHKGEPTQSGNGASTVADATPEKPIANRTSHKKS
ncbi:Inner membrane protein YqiK [Planctomycetes bacterium Pan216]|uniref:Inner membrane protein YqiK n=1 Tax=Kolteria novifilia TaxID=2527975 RepID=A0A518B2B9_9BACT|nr:Inner membrane protein YqiK [Planctomycetes bacterium Pan216]